MRINCGGGRSPRAGGERSPRRLAGILRRSDAGRRNEAPPHPHGPPTRERSGGRQSASSDRLPDRLEKAEKLGAKRAWDPTKVDIAAELRNVTAGRGADVVIVAASAPGIVEQAVALTRPGARIMLFAQTSPQEKFELDGAGVGKSERMVFGSYSASVDLQRESAEIVWREDFPVEDLISHRLPLAELERGIEIARRPQDGSLKVLVYPQEQS